MNELSKSILDLYNTFLGYFSFFRKLIVILLTMVDKFDEMVAKVTSLELDLIEAKENIKSLEDRISILTSKPHNSPVNFTRSSPSEIMERQWKARVGEETEE